MKKILFIFLLFPLTISAQTYFPVDNINVKNILRIGSWYIVKSNDSIWIEKPLGVFQNRIDTTRSGGGSGTVYAGNGIIKRNDTLLLSGNATYNDFTTYKLVNDKYFALTDINENFGLDFSTFSGTYNVTLKGGLAAYPRSSITATNTGVNLGYTKTNGGNTLTLQVSDGGAVFSEMPDTTQTTETHLMTEAQVKREINAADEWKPDGDGGIIYESGGLSNFDGEGGLTLSFVGNTLGLSPQQITSLPLFINSMANKLSINYKDGTNAIGIFSDDTDTIKFGRNNLGVNQGDYFFTTKHGSIGIISNGVKTYEVDSIGHVSFKGTYASIYRARALGDTTQSIPTGTSPTKITAFSTNGEQSNCTADKTNDKITITKPGRYMVNLSLSYASGTNAVNWTAYIFKAGVECENMHSTGYTATANDKRSTAMSGIINVTSVPCDIDYRVTHSSGSDVNLIFSYVNLNVNYIGD